MAVSPTNPFTGIAGQATSGQTPAGSTTPTAGSAPTTASQVAPPSAAYSPYEFQQTVATYNIYLGQQMAESLGLGTGEHNGADVMRAFEDLPTSALIQVESQLYAAGFYASDTGEPLSSRVTLGGHNPDDFSALAAAIIATSNAGPNATLTGIISQQITSGAAYAAQQTALQPVSGGGKTYQVNQTSPSDVYATAMQVFEQYLGRFPTQQELAAYTAGYNQLSTQYQQAQNTQTENMTQQQYKTALAQRQAELTPAVPNANGSGQVPNGPFTNASQYAVAVLEYMGATPTANSVALLTSWINANGGLHGQGQFNPLGVQATATGSTPGKNGAENYTSWGQGIANAVGLLTSPQYSDLRATLMTGSSTLNSVAKSELSQWTNGAVTSLKPTKTVLNQANQAVSQYIPQQNNPTSPTSAGPGYESQGNLPTVGANENMTPNGVHLGSTPTQSTLLPGMASQGNQSVNTTNQVGYQSVGNLPTVGGNDNVMSTSSAVKPGSPFSPTTEPFPNAVGGGQGMTSPGDTYIPSSTLTDTTPPSLSDYLTTQATTGANQLPYMVNQYLQAYQNIVGIIKGEF